MQWRVGQLKTKQLVLLGGVPKFLVLSAMHDTAFVASSRQCGTVEHVYTHTGQGLQCRSGVAPSPLMEQRRMHLLFHVLPMSKTGVPGATHPEVSSQTNR